ncbi:hybrid sensor histidine kinase/response regulator [Aliiglaciecola litoralis]|uniref:histidine kinase n=1 Tax=Aliiglaciecola litoralis TaxID=582857 RepID=A0ABN1LEA8_9ALTE
MSATTSLKLLLDQLFTRLIGGVLVVVAGVFFMFSLLFAEYRSSTNAALTFEKNLFDILQQINKTNLDVEAWRLNGKSVNRKQIKQHWQKLTVKLVNIEQTDDTVELTTLASLMRQLEARHKRVVDIVLFDLDKPHDKLFNEQIVPSQVQLFLSLTNLVESSVEAANLELVKASADLRGYFTKSQGILSELVRNNPRTTWQTFNQALQRVDTNLSLARQFRGQSTRYDQELENFNTEYLKFLHNVRSFKQMTTNHLYYDLAMHSLQINKLSQQIDKEVSRLNEHYFASLQSVERNLWLMIALSLLITLLGLIFCVRLLTRWKESFVHTICNPISAICTQSQKIASGDTDVILETESTVSELAELITAIDDIKRIVASNVNETKLRQRVHKYKEKFNQLQYQESTLEGLVTLSLDFVVKFSGALAAALYLKPDSEDQPLTLFETYNKSSRNLQVGQEMHEGLLEQVTKSKEIAFYDLSDQQYNVDSALVTLRPSHLCIFPMLDNAELVGVLELVLPRLNESEQRRVYEILERFTIVIVSRLNLTYTEQLLQVTQQQQIKLAEAMDEMKQQHAALQRSETELEVQADELKLANSQLKKQNEEAEEHHSRLAELNTTLRKTSNELKKASELKSQFLSKVSHELRTPLNSIIILIQTLLRKPESLDQQQLKSLEVVHNSGQDLLELINDLLDMARIEAGEIKVHFDQYSIADAMERLKSMFMPIAQDKQLEFIVEMSGELPKDIYTDIQRLQQVLRNLLSNAFKFTKQGQVTLIVTCEDEWLKFTVKDTGIGIEPNAQAKIFDAFNQVNNSGLSAREGTGLGLSISSQLAEVLGGRIEIHSEVGKGSIFTFLVPNSQSEPNNASKTKDSVTLKPERSSNQISSQSTQSPQPSAPQYWYVLGATNALWQAVSSSNKSAQWLVRSELSDLASLAQDSDLIAGLVIFVQDEILAQLNKSKVKKQLESLASTISIIVISIDSKKQVNPWLDALASQSLVWNDQAIKHLHNVIVEQQRVSADLAASSVPLLPSITFSDNRRVLIIEDDMRSLFSMGQLMKLAGLEAELADNLTLAKEKIQEFSFDAVITDLVLPDGDGLAFIKELRQIKHYDSIPIIVLSAKNLQEDKDKCQAMGASYFDKPTNTNQLLAELHRVLESGND